MMAGNLPVLPTHASLSASGRAAAPSTVRNGGSQRFFATGAGHDGSPSLVPAAAIQPAPDYAAKPRGCGSCGRTLCFDGSRQQQHAAQRGRSCKPADEQHGQPRGRECRRRAERNRGNMRPYSPSANGTSAGANRQASRGIGESGGYRPYTQPGNRSTAPSMGQLSTGHDAECSGGKPRRVSSVHVRRAAAIVRRRWEQRPSNGARSNRLRPAIRAGSVRSRRPSNRSSAPSSMGSAPQRGTYQSAPAENRGSYRPSILRRGTRWAAARTRTVGATVIIGIAPPRVTVRRSSGATAARPYSVVATGVAHLRVRSWICASRLYAPRRMAAVACAAQLRGGGGYRAAPPSYGGSHSAPAQRRSRPVATVAEVVADTMAAEAAGGGGAHSGGGRWWSLGRWRRSLRRRSSLKVRDEQ